MGEGSELRVKIFMWAVACLGAAACAVSLARTSAASLDSRFLVIALAAIFIGSRLGVKIPHARSEVTASETFIFLSILLFDPDAAVLLAAAEALCASLRVTRRSLTRLFNAGLLACSYFLTVSALRLCFGPDAAAVRRADASFLLFVALMAGTQFFANSLLAAVTDALRSGRPLWRTWRRNFSFTALGYFAAASAAGLIAKLTDLFGFYAFVAAAPVIAVIYFTYWTYLKKVEASNAQAEEARRAAEQARAHVEELSRQMREQERIRRALQESEERFRTAFDHAAVGMALVSPEGRWLQVNRSLCELLGRAEDELLASDFQSATHAESLTAALGQIDRLLRGESPTCQAEMRFVHGSGQPVWTSLSVSLVSNSAQGVPHLIFQIQDITDRKRAEEQLIHGALHDALTGLPNRALFMDHLKLAIDRAKRRPGQIFALLFLDLDRFKVINDSLGHMIGDQLLVAIARRLEAHLRPGDTVARLGGDEFTVLLEDINDVSEATEVAERLQAELSAPFILSGREVFTTVSIGVAPSTLGYMHSDDVLRDADTAMYRAKSRGKARYALFDKAMHSRAVDIMQLETDLRRAVERGEFVLHYQPIVSLEDFTISGFEALVRWQHPERGLIPPDEFIPVAEEMGLISAVGDWVLAEAARQMKEWQSRRSAPLNLTMNVNISSRQFARDSLVERVEQILRETGVEARWLKLEITENLVMESIETATRLMHRLRALGVQLAIDDFGTGYSSLSYLHRFPVTTLKVDRSFVMSMADNNENTEIVRTILMLARNLGMDVVAEGVETNGQLRLLRESFCEYGQGYFFCKPVPAEEAWELLSKLPTAAPAPLPPPVYETYRLPLEVVAA
ncbi:MAG TPA: EAL domain-containing protein [Pyrinomonadaceae bacterium]|nr:EAL domain-containing protein [Pyrinomonadaceae bacterium]